MTTPSLRGWSRYENPNFGSLDSPEAQQWFKNLGYYVPGTELRYDSNPEGGNSRNYVYSPDMDWRNKLPKNAFGSVGISDIYELSDNFNPKELYDPKLVKDDPIYGKITLAKNVKDSKTMLDWAGPLAVSAITAGLAGPAAFGSLGLGAKAGMAIPKLAQSIATGGGFNPMSLLSLGTNFLPADIAPLAKAGLSGFNAYNAFDKGDKIGGLSNLYKIGNSLNITGGP